ncbi:MAG: hypothetical protein WB341_05065 [Terracidiphilus sp.]
MRKYSFVVSIPMLCLASALLVPGLDASGKQHTKWPSVKVAEVPEVGKTISPPRGSMGCVIAAAQIDPCYLAIANGISYQVAYRQDGSLFRVTDVRTIGSDFVSPEDLKVGEIIAISKPGDLILAPYFAVYANHGTTWIPVVGGIQNDVTVVGVDGRDKATPVNQLRFGSGEIHVRIMGFVQRKGVDR